MSGEVAKALNLVKQNLVQTLKVDILIITSDGNI